MTIGSIPNSFSTQASVTSLANSEKLLQQAQKALSTGQSVNAPSDNPTAYYAAQGFLQQASDLTSLKDNLSTALTTVSSTVDSISSIKDVVGQLQGIVSAASSTTDATARAGFAQQYNALLPQLDQLANDAGFNGTNLLNGSSGSLTVSFNANNKSTLTISSVDATSNGLGIGAASNNFASSADLNAASAQLSSALSTLDVAAANLGNNATLIETNQDFTSNLTNNLQGAADTLTAADPNQEAASLLATQVQSQLGVVSLSISGQLEQAVLKLFS
jgi:flagellin-like hook-associated protein FlgL